MTCVFLYEFANQNEISNLTDNPMNARRVAVAAYKISLDAPLPRVQKKLNCVIKNHPSFISFITPATRFEVLN